MDHNLDDAIASIMELLYGGPSPEVSGAGILKLKAHFPDGLIEHAIEILRRSDLVVPSWSGGVLKRTGPGLKAYATGTFLALALGKDYIAQISAPAIVHIVVTGKMKPETGAAGFYCADAGNRLVTASHNVLGRSILRIEDANGALLHNPPVTIQAHIAGLDLAILDVSAPAGTPGLRIEWDREEAALLKPVYVVGFPQIPQQGLALVIRSSEIESISPGFGGRTTYLITDVTSGGFSGGPALNARGLVIGVVEGKPFSPTPTGSDTGAPDLSDAQQYDAKCSVLTPARYLDYLLKKCSPG